MELFIGNSDEVTQLQHACVNSKSPFADAETGESLKQKGDGSFIFADGINKLLMTPGLTIKTPSSQEEYPQYLSRMAISNLFTMAVTSQIDSRQSIPNDAGIPDLETRRLRAKLILEEAFETVEALGFAVTGRSGKSEIVLDPKRLYLVELSKGLNMEDAIDGCIDTMYVCVGTLMAMGVPDLPFVDEVCRANEEKFPNGKPIVNGSGKFLKPEGWNPPDILGVLAQHAHVGLNELSKQIVHDYNENICGEEATE